MIDPDTLRWGSTAAALVTQIAVTTAVCGWGGRQADGWFQTGPKLQLAGFVVGFSLGMTAFLLYISRQSRDDHQPTDPPK